MKYKIVPDAHYSGWYTLWVKPGRFRCWRKAGWHYGMAKVDEAIDNLPRCY